MVGCLFAFTALVAGQLPATAPQRAPG